MKGLFVKDLKLMLLQKNYFLLILAIVIGMNIFSDDTTFPLGFLCFSALLLTISTISYDDFDHGHAFLLTLPVTRSHYVIEKYLLGLISEGLAWILGSVLGIAAVVFKGSIPAADFIMSSLLLLPFPVLFLAVMLPFQLKFGGDKGRIAMIGTFGALAVIVLVIIQGAKAIFHVDLIYILNTLPAVSISMFTGITLILALIIFAGSIRISLAIFQKKEF